MWLHDPLKTDIKAMKHTYPHWDHLDDQGMPLDGPREVWTGNMRIVGRQRARKLRRRGVPIMRSIEVTTRGRHRHAWFTELVS